MDSGKRLAQSFCALWFLGWAGWAGAIYLEDDIFVFAFVELALGIPLLIGAAWLIIAKIRSWGRKTPAPPKQ
jgi:hypothetical protein